MKTIEYKNNGLVFYIDIYATTGAVFNAANRISTGFLNRIDSADKRLFDFHEAIEHKPYEIISGPCEIIIRNGEYNE